MSDKTAEETLAELRETYARLLEEMGATHINEIIEKAQAFDKVLLSITEHASRYSTGSQGRIALETLALEIRERG